MLDHANLPLPKVRAIQLPEVMMGLDRDQRGFPIPYTTFRDKDGTPNYRRGDTRKLSRCLEHGLCAISGTPMPRDDVWLLGGRQSAYHPLGAYLRPPARKECLIWALQMCPYLVLCAQLEKNPLDDDCDAGILFYEHKFRTDDIVSALSDVLVLSRTDGIHLNNPNRQLYFLLANRPWLEVEHWKSGELVEVRTRAQTIQEMNAWRESCDEEVPRVIRRLNRGYSMKRFPWDQ